MCRTLQSSITSTVFLQSSRLSLYTSLRHSARSVLRRSRRFSPLPTSVLTRNPGFSEGNRIKVSVFLLIVDYSEAFSTYFVCANYNFLMFFRYSSSDPSKSELSSENGNKVCTSEEVVVEHENCDAMVDIGEVSVEPHGEGSKFVIELPRTLKYDCGSPDDCVSTPSGVEADFALELVDPPSAVVPHVQEAPEKDSSDGETQYHDMCLSERKNDVTVCDWESLISDTADILIFNSPNRTEAYRGLIQNSLEPATRFCTSLAAELDNEHHMQIVEPVSFEQEDGEGPFSQTGDAGGLPNNPSEAMDHEAEACVTFSCKVKVKK